MQQFAQRVGQRGHRPPDVPFRKRIADAVGNGAQFQERHSALQAGIKERRAFHILDLHPDAIGERSTRDADAVAIDRAERNPCRQPRAVVTPAELRREIAGHERTGIGGALRSDQHRLPDGQSAAGIRPRDPGKDQQLRVAIADRRHRRHSAAIRADPGDPDFGPVGGTVAERRYFRLRRTQYDDLFVLHGKRF